MRSDTEPSATGQLLKIAVITTGAVILLLVVLTLMRRTIAAYAGEIWLARHGVPAAITVSELGLTSARGSIALGQGDRPDLATDIGAKFSWHWLAPHIASVDIIAPKLRAHFDGHTVSAGAVERLVDLFTPQDSAPSQISPTVTVHDGTITVIAPYGELETDIAAQMKSGKLTFLDAVFHPAMLRGNGTMVRVESGRIAARDVGGAVHATFEASVGASRANGPWAEQILVHLSSDAVDTSLTKPTPFQGTISAYGLHDPLRRGTATLSSLVVKTDGAAASTADGWSLAANLHVRGAGHVNKPAAQTLIAQIPLIGTDAQNADALAKALSGFSFAAQNVRADYANAQWRVQLPQPVTLQSQSGAQARIESTGSLLAAANGRMIGQGKIALDGGGLPQLQMEVARYAVSGLGGTPSIDARIALNGQLSTARFQAVSINADAAIQTTPSRFRMALANCAQIGAGAVRNNGRAQIRDVKATLCQTGGRALLAGSGKGWWLEGTLKNVSARLAAADAQLRDGAGTFSVSGNAAKLFDGTVNIHGGRIADLEKPARFASLNGSGSLSLASGQWQGAIALTTASGSHKLATVAIRHDMDTGDGKAVIDARNLIFSPSGLKTSALSPLLSSIRDANGTANFAGTIAWTPKGSTSSGRLTAKNFAFLGPLGPVKGADFDVRFKSLMPIVTQAGQRVHIDQIAWLLPITDVSAKFAVNGNVATLDSGSLSVANGTVAIDPTRLALDGKGEPAKINLHLTGIDLEALVSASNLADRVSIKASVSGNIPLQFGPNGVRLDEGRIASIGPGELSIKRTLWSSASENPNAIQDFAFQAMEHLAIDEMSGTVQSQPGGRLGLLLHIKGRNNPEKAQTPEVSVFDLLNGKAFDRPLPLPKGTEVNLTLDTSLNFDELLAAYGELHTGATGF